MAAGRPDEPTPPGSGQTPSWPPRPEQPRPDADGPAGRPDRPRPAGAGQGGGTDASGPPQGERTGGWKQAAHDARKLSQGQTPNAPGPDASQLEQQGSKAGAEAGAQVGKRLGQAAGAGALSAVTGKAGEMAGRLLGAKAGGFVGRHGLKILIAAVVASFMPFVLVAALIGGPVSGIPYALADEDTADDEIPPDVLDVYYQVATEYPEVPWTILAAIGYVQTDHGRHSPYDGIDRDPGRTTSSDVQAARPADTSADDELLAQYGDERAIVPKTIPPIGDASDHQGLGPMLLRPEAAVAVDDPQDFEASVEHVAAELARIREELDVEGYEYDDRRPETVDRYWAEAVDRLAGVIAEPSGLLDECPEPSGQPGDANLNQWIDAIWRCEIAAARQDGHTVQVVDRVTVGDDGVLSFHTIPEAAGVQVLLMEARTVALAFTGGDASGGDASGAHTVGDSPDPVGDCDDAKALAGIFPVWSGVEGRAGGYGSAIDRCDIKENIRLAARAVLAVETTAPATRSTRLGAYQPMAGGWANLPWALGGGRGLELFATHGPYGAWVPSEGCEALLDDTLSSLAGSQQLDRYADTPPTARQATALLDGSGLADLRTASACQPGGQPLPERSWVDFMGRQVSSYATRMAGGGEHEHLEHADPLDDADGEAHAAEHGQVEAADDQAATAMANWAQALNAALPPRPDYVPGRASALSRLTATRTGPADAPDAPTFAGAGLSTGTQVTNRAIYYGGLFPGDERAGQKGSGLMAGGHVSAEGLVAAGVPEVAAQAYAAAWAAAPPECGIRLEVIAGIGKVETGHFTHGGAQVGPDGTVSPAIIGIPLDGTNGTMRIPDTDGGRYDNDTTWDRAVGPMQFIPTTWESVAGGKDPQNIYAATEAAVNYLCAFGPMDTASAERAAILKYNRAGWYADKVLAAAQEYSMAAAASSADMVLNPGTEIPTVTVGGITVAVEVGPQLKALLDAAAADGIILGGYGYRSTQRQIELRQTNGCPDIWTSSASSCRVPTAIPGRSMHEKGHAVDFSYNGQTICFPNPPSRCHGNAGFDWLKANAHRFGFQGISSEAWHFSTNGR